MSRLRYPSRFSAGTAFGPACASTDSDMPWMAASDSPVSDWTFAIPCSNWAAAPMTASRSPGGRNTLNARPTTMPSGPAILAELGAQVTSIERRPELADEARRRLADAGYRTNETIFSLTELPSRIAVIGAGKIGELMLSGLLRAGWPAGQLLATVTFTGETASGWQQATFSTPVAVTATSGAKLERAQINRVDQLQNIAPGLVIQPAVAQPGSALPAVADLVGPVLGVALFLTVASLLPAVLAGERPELTIVQMLPGVGLRLQLETGLRSHHRRFGRNPAVGCQPRHLFARSVFLR